MANYKFFQNKSCEYFPCHKHVDEEDFNCLFCYCPLYMLKEECGGNFKYSNGMKDCSACTKNHTMKAYDNIMDKIDLVLHVVKSNK